MWEIIYREICNIERCLSIIFKFFYLKRESDLNINYLFEEIDESLVVLQEEDDIIILEYSDEKNESRFKGLFPSINKLLEKEEFSSLCFKIGKKGKKKIFIKNERIS